MKIICIGRNYAEHAKELNNPVPENPVVFLKPPTALLVNNKDFYYPDFTNDLHYECEIVLKIDKNGRHVQPAFADSYFTEISLGIDFTARDLQSRCKQKGHPWEIAKGFDNSAVLGKFVKLDQFDRNNIEFYMERNGEKVQHGFSKDMLFSFNEIIVYVSRFFKLQTGDLIYTGTPAGVGPVQKGDVLKSYLVSNDQQENEIFSCKIK